MYNMLKAVKYRIDAYFSIDSLPGLFFKLSKKLYFIISMKRINNFIRKANKTIYRINRITQTTIQAIYAQRETSAICARCLFATSYRYVIVNFLHISLALIKTIIIKCL